MVSRVTAVPENIYVFLKLILNQRSIVGEEFCQNGFV